MKQALIAIVLVGIFGRDSFGDPPPTAAESLYLEGQTAYVREDFRTAIEKWQASYALSGENDLLFNLAQAYRLSGDCKRALETYKKFITADPAADQLVLAVDFVHELEPQCKETVPVRAKPAQPVSVRTQIPPPPSKPTTVPAPGSAWKIAGLAAGGAGVAMITSGLALGHHGGSIGDEITAACQVSCDWEALRDKDARGRRDVTIGRVLDVAGVVGIASGAVLYYVGVRRGTLTVSPSREGGGAVAWNGSW